VERQPIINFQNRYQQVFRTSLLNRETNASSHDWDAQYGGFVDEFQAMGWRG